MADIPGLACVACSPVGVCLGSSCCAAVRNLTKRHGGALAPSPIGDDATVRIGIQSLSPTISFPFEVGFGVAADVDDRCNVLARRDVLQVSTFVPVD